MLTQPNVAFLIGLAFGYLMAAFVIAIFYWTRRKLKKNDSAYQFARSQSKRWDSLCRKLKSETKETCWGCRRYPCVCRQHDL